MKIKGPIFIGEVVVGSSDIMVDVSISSSELISELDMRRPCEKCDHARDMAGACIHLKCIWQPRGNVDEFMKFIPSKGE